MDKYVSARRIAKLFGVCPETLRQWSNEGKLNYIRTKGNHRRYFLSDIEKIQNEQQTEQPKELIEWDRLITISPIYFRKSQLLLLSEEENLKTQIENTQCEMIRCNKFNVGITASYNEKREQIGNTSISGELEFSLCIDNIILDDIVYSNYKSLNMIITVCKDSEYLQIDSKVHGKIKFNIDEIVLKCGGDVKIKMSGVM